VRDPSCGLRRVRAATVVVRVVSHECDFLFCFSFRMRGQGNRAAEVVTLLQELVGLERQRFESGTGSFVEYSSSLNNYAVALQQLGRLREAHKLFLQVGCGTRACDGSSQRTLAASMASVLGKESKED